MYKKLLLSIVLGLLTLTSCAQNVKKITKDTSTYTKHLSFKGVPIDGPLSKYVLKMKEAGFVHSETDDGTAVLEGDFAGYKGCIIIVSTLKKLDIVNTIGVIFPEKDHWSSLEGNYEDLKSMLTQKYGDPATCVETFQTKYPPESDFDKLRHLQFQQCEYYTTFKTPQGIIQLSLAYQDGECFVRLQYWDKINTEAIRSQAMDDL